MNRKIKFGLLGLVVVLLAVGAAIIRFGWDRLVSVPPHTKLTVYQPPNCTLYLLGVNPQAIAFSGETFSHNVSGGEGGVYDVGISGTGRILFKNATIEVQHDRVFVNDKPLDSRPCAYIVRDNGTVTVGAIRTYD